MHADKDYRATYVRWQLKCELVLGVLATPKREFRYMNDNDNRVCTTSLLALGMDRLSNVKPLTFTKTRSHVVGQIQDAEVISEGRASHDGFSDY